MEDFPIEFEFDLLELEKKKLARQNRIVAGRLESLKYKAKIEFPYWFKKEADHKSEIYKIHELYLRKSYEAVITQGIILLQQSRDQVELIDVIIRSALKLSNSSTQIIEIAKLYLQHTSYPGLSFTASLFFKQANMLSDAISSCLHTISLRGSLPPYINHLISLFPITTTSSDSQNIKNERIQNLLSKKALRRLVTSSEVDCLIEHLELEAQDHKTMSGLLSFVEEVEESEEVRNVRSL